MAKTTGVIRSEVILRMKGAIKAGKSASAFIRDMRDRGLSYRRTDMLSDFRNVGNIEKKTGLLKYVRKDYLPTAAVATVRDWNLSREYLFNVRVKTRLAPGKPTEDRFVNIVSDRPMTPREIETEVQKSWGSWYPERREELVAVIPETAIRRAS